MHTRTHARIHTTQACTHAKVAKPSGGVFLTSYSRWSFFSYSTSLAFSCTDSPHLHPVHTHTHLLEPSDACLVLTHHALIFLSLYFSLPVLLQGLKPDLQCTLSQADGKGRRQRPHSLTCSATCSDSIRSACILSALAAFFLCSKHLAQQTGARFKGSRVQGLIGSRVGGLIGSRVCRPVGLGPHCSFALSEDA